VLNIHHKTTIIGLAILISSLVTSGILIDVSTPSSENLQTERVQRSSMPNTDTLKENSVAERIYIYIGSLTSNQLTLIGLSILPTLLYFIGISLYRSKIRDLVLYSDNLVEHGFSLPPFKSKDSLGRLAVTIALLSRRTKHLLKNTEEIEARANKEMKNAQFLSLFDPLTKLSNRRSFEQFMQKKIISLGRETSTAPTYLFYIDMDNFKDINDIYGHSDGDKVLTTLSDRFRSFVNLDDLAARLGGDEFVLALRLESEQLTEMTESLLCEIVKPIELGNSWIQVTCSIGVVEIDNPELNTDKYLNRADLAMYHAKKHGKNRYCVFFPEMESKASNYKFPFSNLKLKEFSEFLEVHFQPKYSLKSRVYCGIEALVRWKGSNNEQQLGTSDFIAGAEKTRLIIQLGFHILEQAMAAGTKAMHMGTPIPVAVNISIEQLLDPGFEERVLDMLAENRMPPNLLEIEIREVQFRNDLEDILEVLSVLRNSGVSIVLDDYGIGFCSMNDLKMLPVDTLKIDKSFISGIESNGKQKIILEALVKQGKALDLAVGALGVENQSQLTILDELQCDIVQGHFLCEPKPLSAALNHVYLHNNNYNVPKKVS